MSNPLTQIHHVLDQVIEGITDAASWVRDWLKAAWERHLAFMDDRESYRSRSSAASQLSSLSPSSIPASQRSSWPSWVSTRPLSGTDPIPADPVDLRRGPAVGPVRLSPARDPGGPTPEFARTPRLRPAVRLPTCCRVAAWAGRRRAVGPMSLVTC